MKFKVIVVSKEVLLGERKFDFLSLSKQFLKYGLEVENFEIREDIVVSDSPVFLFLPDSKIDSFLEKERSFFSTKSEIIAGQGVLRMGDSPFAILPLESDIIDLSDKILDIISKKLNLPKLAVYRLYGKGKEEVEKRLEELKIMAKVVGEGLLTDIYINHNTEFIGEDETKISQEYENQIYCESYMPMASVVAKLLALSDAKLSITDTFTNGEIAKELLKSNVKSILTETCNIKREEGFIKIDGEDRCFADEQDLVYQLAFSKLTEKKCNISVVIACKNEGNFFKVFVGIGNKHSVDVYKFSLSGTVEDGVGIAKNATIFNLIKKLRIKDFEN